MGGSALLDLAGLPPHSSGAISATDCKRPPVTAKVFDRVLTFSERVGFGWVQNARTALPMVLSPVVSYPCRVILYTSIFSLTPLTAAFSAVVSYSVKTSATPG